MQLLTLARRGALIFGVALGSGMAMAAGTAPSQAGRPWTPETSIEMRHFALNFSAPQHWPEPGGDGILFSPNRRYFLFLEYRGVVANDTAIARVSIYSSEAVRRALRSRGRAPAPIRSFERESRSSNFPALAELRWDQDSAGLLFEGQDEAGGRNLYHFEIASGQRTPVVTRPRGAGEGIETFDYRNGTSVFLLQNFPRRPTPSYPAYWVPREPDGRPLFQEGQGSNASSPDVTSRAEARCGGRPAPAPDATRHVLRIAVSPTECRALLIVKADGDGWDVHHLNVATGESRAIANVATCQCWISWSPDGRWAVVAARTGANGASPVAIFSRDTGAVEAIGGFAADAGRNRAEPRWLSATQVILPDPGSTTGAARLELRDGRWSRIPGADLAERPREDGFSVSVRQSLNDPPRVVAVSGRTELALSEPDPALAGVARRDWQEISFVAPDGRTTRAALMLPAPVPGRQGPPPLVVNPYWYENGVGAFNRVFLPDGEHEGAESAAQVLAARGFAVLWMDGWVAPTRPRLTEGADFVARLDAAVTELVRRGLVDPDRIGMAGYSRGGFLTFYSATHPGRVRIRTHIAIDNYLGSSAESFYLNALVSGEGNAAGFFVDRQASVERDTLLNVHRIRGPVLFTRSVGAERRYWEQLRIVQGALRSARRPFDELSFPDGVHNLMRPRERIVLINAIADWMAFWLMDETPADAERARIWTQMRAQWQRQQAWEAAGNPVASTPPADFRPASAAAQP